MERVDPQIISVLKDSREVSNMKRFILMSIKI